MNPLPVAPAWRLAERAEHQRWLVSGLWSEEAVGIIGGEPKCCKSFLALDLAVSVAAGTPCLRRFAVPSPGRVLLYAAEDALHIVRRRLDGICTAAGFDLADLDVQVITAPSLRLDLDADRASLDETIVTLKPRLLVLDPFVRLHRIDENVSGEVAPLLAYLRDLQRRHGVAVIVVHHARKGAGNMRAGQALRGSSEFHAWGDSNLYLRREPALAKTPGDVRRTPCRSGNARPDPRTRAAGRRSRPRSRGTAQSNHVSRRAALHRRPHHRNPRRRRPAATIRRSARHLSGANRHPLRTPRRHDNHRPHRQIPRRLPTRRMNQLPLPTPLYKAREAEAGSHQNACPLLHRKAWRRST